MDDMFARFNSHLGGPIGSLIGAIIIFVLGWLVAMGISGLVRKLLASSNMNQRMNSSTGKTHDLENIISKVVFWFIFLMAISGALSMLNLDAISLPFASMITQVLDFIPVLIGAAVVGVIGWIIATIARTAINAALSKTTMDERLSAQAGMRPISDTIAEVVYWVILLITLTMVLGQLGIDGLFAPLTNMLDKAINFIPNLFIAGILFFAGYIAAKIVQGIVTNLVASTNLQGFATKANISNGRENSLPKIAGSLVFLVIIIPVAIAALDALKIEVISRPATNMLNKIMVAIPNIILAAGILIVTYLVMRMIANIVKDLLSNTKVDELPAKANMQDALGDTNVSDLVGHAIIFFAMLFATILAADVLGFEAISALVVMFIDFGANIILGAIILFIGFWLANMVAGVVERSEQGSRFLANIVRVLIMGLVLAMGLKAMGIADSIVNLAFGLTLGAVAVAFALAFGLGGREAAARLLRKMQDKVEEERTGLKVKTTRHTTTTSDDTDSTEDSAEDVAATIADNLADIDKSTDETDTTGTIVDLPNTSTPSSTFNSDDLK